MEVTVNQLQAEIRRVEGIDVVVHTAKPGDTFPSYQEKWRHGLADDRTVAALKRRLAYSLTGHRYGILKSDGNKTQGAGNIYLRTIRGVEVEA